MESRSANEMEVKCSQIPIPDSIFTPPANIDFVDFGQMIASIIGMGDGNAFDICAICEMITNEDEKAECLAECG